jgi:hypothetical protein
MMEQQVLVQHLPSCLPLVGGSLRVLRFLPPLKTGRHDIAEILLKVALSTKKSQAINKHLLVGLLQSFNNMMTRTHDMMTMSGLNLTVRLSWILIVLAHRYNSTCVNKDTAPLLLLDGASLAEKQKIQISLILV